MPAGRPSSYKEEYAAQAKEYALLGATNEEIADAFGVARSTLQKWAAEIPDFSVALKSGRERANADIAAALYNRAKGAEWVEEQAFKIKVGPNEERVETVEVRRAAPPDTTAAIFWLKNRRPDLWRDKRDIEASGDLIVQIVKLADAEDSASG